MALPPSIDLHPENIPGSGPEAALRACRSFLDKALKSGHREVRIITGVGLRGDGTPRLRQRVEQEVLAGFYRFVEQTSYEQGGAVIHVWLRAVDQKPTTAWVRHQRHLAERSQVADREERLGIAYDRLDQAEAAFEEGDFRRCRLKLNQVAREFGWEIAGGELAEAEAQRLLDAHWTALKERDR
jgi:hypothetical protein